jgi:CBS domain-containing protein
MLVHQILKSKSDDGVVTIPPGTSVGAAAEMLSSRRIGAVIVSVDGKKPLGILSRARHRAGAWPQGAGCLTETVDTMMTPSLCRLRAAGRGGRGAGQDDRGALSPHARAWRKTRWSG